MGNTGLFYLACLRCVENHLIQVVFQPLVCKN